MEMKFESQYQKPPVTDGFVAFSGDFAETKFKPH